MGQLRHGSQTSVGIEPRISHEFNKVSHDELTLELTKVDYALYLAAVTLAQGGDPSQLEIYKNPYGAAITRSHFGW